MTRANKKRLGTGRYRPRPANAWELFDSFPAPVREALNYSPFSINELGIKRLLDRGTPPKHIVAAINVLCDKKAAADRFAVWQITDPTPERLDLA